MIKPLDSLKWLSRGFIIHLYHSVILCYNVFNCKEGDAYDNNTRFNEKIQYF